MCMIGVNSNDWFYFALLVFTCPVQDMQPWFLMLWALASQVPQVQEAIVAIIANFLVMTMNSVDQEQETGSVSLYLGLTMHVPSK